jgi:hypothetical protein
MTRADASLARIYRRLLVLYPSEFRLRYADEMVQLFGDQLREARLSGKPAGSLRTVVRATADLALTSALEHAGRNRTVAHSVTAAPSVSSRLLGMAGIIGGLVLVAAFLPSLALCPELNTVRLVLFNAGAIAIVIAVHRRRDRCCLPSPGASAVPSDRAGRLRLTGGART